ncbi:unnamed protein product [Rhizopus stolonifer]
MIYLLIVFTLLCNYAFCFPLVANYRKNDCNANDSLIHLGFEQEDNNFGYIYILNSTSVNLNADIDINSNYVFQEMESAHAVAVISHISYSETNSTFLLQAWISPTNKIKMKQLGHIVQLEFFIHSFDKDQQSWSSRSYRGTQVTAKVQNTDNHENQTLVVEITPDNTVKQHIWLPSEAEQWVTWDMTCSDEQA